MSDSKEQITKSVSKYSESKYSESKHTESKHTESKKSEIVLENPNSQRVQRVSLQLEINIVKSSYYETSYKR